MKLLIRFAKVVELGQRNRDLGVGDCTNHIVVENNVSKALLIDL